MLKKLMSTLGLLVVIPLLASASQIFTATGSVPDGSVNAQATFSLLNGQLVIKIDDLLANPTSVGQLVSDLQFQIAGVSSVSLAGSSAQQVSVSSSGQGTLGSTGTTGWTAGSFSGGFIVCVICPNNLSASATPSQLIIGPGTGAGQLSYTNANGSIAEPGATRPHNPFLYKTASFTLNAPGITGSSVVTNVVFSFGTQFGVNVNGTQSGGGGTVGGGPVPEPTTLFLGTSGLIAGLLLRRKKAVS
jgi:hypothetical protein